MVFHEKLSTAAFLSEIELDQQLQSLILDKKFCEAENTLFERMTPGDDETLKIALKFYTDLNLLGCNL